MLRILTLNLNYYGTQHGPWSVRQEIITAALRQAQPDIMAFQAVAQDPAVGGGKDQAAQLAAQLEGYKYGLFCPTQSHATGLVEGMAVYSRLPIAATQHRELSLRPGLDDTNPRILLHAQFELSDGPLHLFNAHFSWVAEQTQENLNEVLPYAQGCAGRAVLVGDLNTPASSPLLAQLRQEGWTDGWAALYPQDPGYTFVEGGQFCKRIDYAWVREELAGGIKDVQIVAAQPNGQGHRASDHAGLLLTLDVEI